MRSGASNKASFFENAAASQSEVNARDAALRKASPRDDAPPAFKAVTPRTESAPAPRKESVTPRLETLDSLREELAAAREELARKTTRINVLDAEVEKLKGTCVCWGVCSC